MLAVDLPTIRGMVLPVKMERVPKLFDLSQTHTKEHITQREIR